MKAKTKSRADAIKNLDERLRLVRKNNDENFKWAKSMEQRHRALYHDVEELLVVLNDLNACVVEFLTRPWWKRLAARFIPPKSFVLMALNEQHAPPRGDTMKKGDEDGEAHG